MGSIIRHVYSWAGLRAHYLAGIRDGIARRFDLPTARIATIYNAVDLASVQRQAALPLPHDTPVDGPYIVSIGRLNPKKGTTSCLKLTWQAERDGTWKLVDSWGRVKERSWMHSEHKQRNSA